MAIKSENVKTIVSMLEAAKIETITKEIKADANSIFYYLSIVEDKYPNLDSTLANAKNAFDVVNVFRAIAMDKNKRVFKRVMDNLLFPEHIDTIWSKLQQLPTDDIGISCETLKIHMNAARKYFPDIASTLALYECPVALKQAVESVLSYDDNRLRHFLKFGKETYGDSPVST